MKINIKLPEVLMVIIFLYVLLSSVYWASIEIRKRKRDTYSWMVRVDTYRQYKNNIIMLPLIIIFDPTVMSLSKHLGSRY